MALLSTSSRLIKVGQDYSAGSGISINDHVISVTGEFGKVYSAGENISIDGNVINSKDWTNDIANASANAYNQATAQIPEPFDPTYLSGEIDNKLNSTAFTSWQNGQYSTDLQTIEGQISNKLDKSAFSDVSASFLTAINIPESATWNEVSQAYEQASGTYLTAHQSLDGYATEQWVKGQGYLTGVSIPESASWNETTTVVQSNSAQWAEGGTGGDEEVNELVHSNSATWNEVSSKLDESTFQESSGLFLTAIPQEYITESDIPNFISAKLDTTAFADVSGNFLTAVDLTPYVPASSIGTQLYEGEPVVSFISGVKISAFVSRQAYYATQSIDAKTANVAYRDANNNSITTYYQPKLYFSGIDGTITAINSSALAGDEEVNTLVHTNSATWNTVTDKLDTTAQVVTGYTTATIEGTSVVNSLNGKALIAFRAASAQQAGVANNARYDYEGNNLVDDHNSLTALNNYVQTNSANWGSGSIRC